MFYCEAPNVMSLVVYVVIVVWVRPPGWRTSAPSCITRRNIKYKCAVCYLNDLHVLLAPLGCQARHAAELLVLCVVDGGSWAADELSWVQRPRHGLDLQALPQRTTVTGWVHHHGLGARVDLRLHHGDLQDVRHRRLLTWWPRARLGDQLGGGLAAAEDWRWMVGGAKGDLSDSGALCDDWLLWWR